jgi:hypothetical protein
MRIIKAPEPLPVQRVVNELGHEVVPKSVFLAGSIEMGKAEDWQTIVTDTIGQSGYMNYIFNPRRDDWDSSWEQSINNPQFNEQVSWEMTALDCAEEILLYFCEDTKSPISLLELGLHAKSGKLTVVCPNGFWRRGNVEMVCNRYRIPLLKSLEEYFSYKAIF